MFEVYQIREMCLSHQMCLPHQNILMRKRKLALSLGHPTLQGPGSRDLWTLVKKL